VNHLTPGFSSEDRQLHSVFSYDYYHPPFQFCQPDGGAQRVSESLGSILFGDRIYTSAYELHMLKNETCKAVCGARKIDAESAQFVNERIWQSYNLNWLIDGLPAAQPATDPATQTEYFTPGFLLGSVVDGQPQLHNHVDLTIDYHAIGGGRMRVVGVLAQPSSRRDARVLDGGKVDCGDAAAPLLLSETASTLVTWTYSVAWRPSGQAWATRWDKYLHVFDPRIHWFSLIYSAGIVLCLTGLVGMILVRVLRKDIARYNRLDSFDLGSMNGTSAALDDGVQEDSGWKLVHGDVFRAPSHPLILSILLGNGAQLFVMAGVTICMVSSLSLLSLLFSAMRPYVLSIHGSSICSLPFFGSAAVFAMLGFLSPSNRGSIGTIAVLLYTILGFVGGYVSARSYKMFGGDAWKRNISLTPVLVPGIVFGTFFILNLFLWAKRSSGAVPFTTMLVIAGIWFTITVPLSVVGSWVGFKQPVSTSTPFSFLLSSSLPFSPLSYLFLFSVSFLGHRGARAHKPDPAPDPAGARVPAPDAVAAGGRPAALRRHLRRALLHHGEHLVGPPVLHVRLPVCVLRAHDHHERRRHHPARVLFAVRRELPLAVARVLRRRR
jgi:transmembrane 9 superfamily protein 2/4